MTYAKVDREKLVLNLRLGTPEPPQIPDGWLGDVRMAQSGVEIVGDHTGQTPIYVLRSDRSWLLSKDIHALFAAMPRPLAVSNIGVSHFLQDGLIPNPRTIFDDLYMLGCGDVGQLEHGHETKVSFRIDYPYFLERSSQGNTPSTDQLLKLLTASVERLTRGASSPLLMMSAGKDSTSIALAAANAGIKDLKCVTFASEDDLDECELAQSFCKKLGLRHETMRLPTDTTVVQESLNTLFRGPFPCSDYAGAPFAIALNLLRPDLVLDGSGSDQILGYTLPQKDAIKYHMALASAYPLRLLRQFVSRVSPLNSLFKTRAEAMIAGNYFQMQEVRRFFPQVSETTPFWRRMDAEYARRDPMDLRALIRGRPYDERSVMLKARVAAAAIGADIKFPWCDQGVADYCFNFPEPARFNRRACMNKILVRKLLREKIGYDDAVIGKRTFIYDGRRLLLDNRSFVEGEINSCALWNPNIRHYVATLYNQLNKNWKYSYAMMHLLFLSGWFNRLRWSGHDRAGGRS